ncbi:alpha-2-macroglobulin family protein [Pseudomarimonas salicorniae]|uniref:Alpha-2-macroglobulin n=1 Tax=Pseudomarimonas salicorniae TaxID=2933270 RepID=A0ABT0GJV2_9GAMM|nr:alpha-2-macroglobulin [Lysobacter sp. CAU 1642]MCK7594647.1 alpha-2-macroglobulin family protein [Lysobacter sp. CAU 1642]
MPSQRPFPSRWIRCGALIAALLLAACSEQPAPGTVEAVGEEEAGASLAPHLSLRSAVGGEFEGRPAIELRFDRALASAQPFDERLRIREANGGQVEGSWQYEAGEQMLRFPYVKPNTTYRIEVGATLEAADGTAPGQPTEREVFSGNLPPLLVFASTGSVLRAGDESGLPVVGVNAPEADVEIFRVRPERYSAFFQRWRGSGERGSWELQDIAKLADSVYATRYALDSVPNERQISHIPVQGIAELREPGVFFAVMRRPGEFGGQYAATHFFVTDIGLHLRGYREAMWVHTASLSSGQPRGGVVVELRDDKGRLLAEGETAGDGGVMLDVPPRPEQVLVARAGREIAVLSLRQPALDLAEFPVAGRPFTGMDAFIWSGRDLYRPGERLGASILLRDHDGRLPDALAPVFAVLRLPDGRSLAPRVLEPGELGSFRLEYPIAEDAPTGRWQLAVFADPKGERSLGRFDFRVEEFLPERLKLALDAPEAPLAAGEALPLSVQGDYLYGAPAAGNRLSVDLIYRPAIHAVPAHRDFLFADPDADLPDAPQQAFDGQLDEDGQLSTELSLLDDERLARQPVSVRVAASLFESGGRAVRRSLVRTLLPAPQLLGARPLFDREDGAEANGEAAFELLRSDAQGALSAGRAKATLIRRIRDYRWTYSPQGGWSADFVSRDEEVDTREVKLLPDGPVVERFRVEWGDYRLQLVDLDSGQVLNLPFHAGWRWEDDNRGDEPRPDKVRVALDKPRYRAGETLTITLTPPYEGPGLVLLETDRLIEARPIQARNGSTVSFELAEDLDRHDLYVSALVFRPDGRSDRASPPRAVGITHVPLDRGERAVALEVEAPEQVAPEQPITLRLSAPALAGQRAFAQVDAVDQGVLALTGYGLPDAAAYFFAQRGLAVEARDLYARLIERLDGSRARLRYGGDAALAGLPQARRPTDRTRTAAVHSGPVEFDAAGKAEVTLAAPAFNGALRIAAIAYAADRFGAAGEETLVRAPLVVEVSTPRVMAPGDRAELAVDLHNLSGRGQSLELRVEGDALLAIEDGARRLQLADQARQTLRLPLRARAEADTGSGRFSVAVRGEGIDHHREHTIAVRAAYPAERRGELTRVDGPMTRTLGQGLAEGLQPGSTTLRAALSADPPIPFSSAAQGLIGYPYGCIEQTASRLWPLVWADAEARERLAISGLDEDRRQSMLRRGFDRLNSLQLASGQFAYWPGDGYANPQMTAPVAELLIVARESGLAIPETVLQRSLDRLNEDLLQGGDGFYAFEHAAHLRFAALAHAGYVLARAGRAPLGALRALHDHERGNSLTALPRLQLALALKLAGDEQRAGAGIDEALAFESERPRYLGDYGSALRDQAWLLALLMENDLGDRVDGDDLLEIARGVRDPSRGNSLLSTQEQLALFRLGRQLARRGDQTLAGSWQQGERVAALGPGLNEWHAALADGPSRLNLESTGQAWLLEDIVGTPRSAPKPVDQGLSIRRSWYTLDGKPFTGARLREGDTLLVRLVVGAEENVPDALVTDLVPGGLEIENLGLGDRGTLEQLVIDGQALSERHWAADKQHEEFRDDRYSAALKLWAGQTATLYYLVRAVSPGRYTVPPPFAEDMYRPGLRSIGPSAPAELEVVGAAAP